MVCFEYHSGIGSLEGLELPLPDLNEITNIQVNSVMLKSPLQIAVAFCCLCKGYMVSSNGDALS